MAQPPVLPAAPGEQLAAGGDGGAVAASAGDVPHPLVPQRLHNSGLLDGLPGAVAELAVLALAPGEDAAVNGESHGVLAAAVHRHLLHHVLRQGRQLARQGDIVAVAETEAAVGALTAGVHLALLGHQEERLGAARDGNGVEAGEHLAEDWQLDL